MFTIEQIDAAHAKVKTGADFPLYIREIKELGVVSFETAVRDSRTTYHGLHDFSASSGPVFEDLEIAGELNKERFIACLKRHQAGETDYLTFCADCAANGILKWVVHLESLTCTYFDGKGQEVMTEPIPA
ncbi:MAG: DUF1398 domain-containing protein [Marinilabiliales bacterium]|nr:DUF1398 domain-containing protein [Marinilabiliales bacterium]